MKTEKIWRRLHDALHTQTSVAIYRGRIDSRPLVGFVIGLSEEWILVHIVSDFMRLNGYRALRVADVTRIETDNSITTRILELNAEVPVAQPDILLIDLPGLLSSAKALFPLVGIKEEYTPYQARIGRVVKVGKRMLTLRPIERNAVWAGTEDRHALKNITMVGFGDAYSAALWRIAQEGSSSRPTDVDTP